MQMRKYPCSVRGKGVGRLELRAVYKMSTMSAQEVFWSSRRFNPREGFYLQKNASLVLLFEDEDKMIILDGDNIEVGWRGFLTLEM